MCCLSAVFDLSLAFLLPLPEPKVSVTLLDNEVYSNGDQAFVTQMLLGGQHADVLLSSSLMEEGTFSV